MHDPERIDYLRDHLGAVHRAHRVPASTYAATSCGRCWTTSSGRYGYSKRFGIVYVDFATQQRIPKDSARWYAAVVATGSVATTGTGTQHGEEAPPGARARGSSLRSERCTHAGVRRTGLERAARGRRPQEPDRVMPA